MKKEFSDILPSRFKSWIEFYSEIKKGADDCSCSLNDESIIRHCGNNLEVGYRYKLSMIKSKALDEILGTDISYEDLIQIRIMIFQYLSPDNSLSIPIERLLSVFPKNHR